jgi:ferritin-like metal-binding protein YciE
VRDGILLEHEKKDRFAAQMRFSRVMDLETLRDLYIHELKDLYSAENQIIKALPKMRRAAKNRRLAAAFNQHLEQTKRQAKRLEQILKRNDESTRAPKCEGMEGLLKEGDAVISDAKEDDVRDAGLIAAAQRVEHYEIAGYGCARTYAQLLRDTAGARLLEMTLREEGATDKKLTKLAKAAINLRAKKASKKIEKERRNRAKSGGVAGALKRIVQKVKG